LELFGTVVVLIPGQIKISEEDMAGKKRSTFASAQNALVKALRNMEKTVAGLVPSVAGGKSKSPVKRRSKPAVKRKVKPKHR
jgi:hypothetical protein